MEMKRAVRLAILIAGAVAVVCAISIIGFRQNSAASAGRRPTITPVLASYERPSESAAAKDSRSLSDANAVLVSAPVETPADDPFQGIPSHKRYVIVGEGPMSAEDVLVPMGVERAEDQ